MPIYNYKPSISARLRFNLFLYNFQLLSASLNPFAGINVTVKSDFKKRKNKAYEVFAGTDEVKPEVVVGTFNDRFRDVFLHVRYRVKHGIFGTLIGLPVQLIYALIPSLFLH